MAHFYFQKPLLRRGCQVDAHSDHLQLRYRDDEFELFPEEGHTVEQMQKMLLQIDGTKTVEELKADGFGYSADEVMDMLTALDESWLLEEGAQPVFTGKSGLQFITHLEDLYRDWEKEAGETKLSQLVLDGNAPRHLMIGWTLEYYHITKRAHDCISPAIAKGHGEFRSMLLDFFHEEYRHDKLLLKSLKSLGFEEHEITNSIPLPYTAAVSNLLAKWAHTDLLSYMASLFIFEGTAMEGNDYVQALDVYEMPREFSIHQAAHNNINTEGDHGNVSREFYASIEYITAEDQARVIRNIRLLHEAQLRAHDTIFEYYLKPDVKMPRLLDNLLVSKA